MVVNSIAGEALDSTSLLASFGFASGFFWRGERRVLVGNAIWVARRLPRRRNGAL